MRTSTPPRNRTTEANPRPQLHSQKLGSIPYWLSFRIAQLIFTIGFTYFATFPRTGVAPHRWLISLIFIAFVVYLNWWVHPLAYGVADANGIRARRYLRMRTIPWEEVQEVSISGWRGNNNITIKLGRNRSNWELVFLFYPRKGWRWSTMRKQMAQIASWMDRQAELARHWHMPNHNS